jgi:uncharacterized protein YacL
MIVEASITGVFRMVLMIVGAIVLLRFFGQLMNAKRNMEEERSLNQKQRKFDSEKKEKLKNFGKTKIVDVKVNNKEIEDVDFEEIN